MKPFAFDMDHPGSGLRPGRSRVNSLDATPHLASKIFVPSLYVDSRRAVSLRIAGNVIQSTSQRLALGVPQKLYLKPPNGP